MTPSIAVTRPTYRFSEWDAPRTVDSEPLSPMDAQLAAALTDAKRLLVEELRGGVRVEPTSWVGVVRFEHFDVEVVPKYAGYNLGLLRMLDYTTGLDALKRAPAVRDLAMDGTSLLDLIGMLLCEEATRLLRDGLLDDLSLIHI